MVLHILNRHLPSANRVALFAIRTQLAFVNVCVAVLAALTDVRENHLHVTRGTCHGSVHPAQRITRLVVVELGNGTDWLPAICIVAVLAGNSEVSVRTMRAFGGGLRSCASRKCGKCQSEDDDKSSCNPSAHDLHPCFRPLYPKIQINAAEDKVNIRLLQFAVQLE